MKNYLKENKGITLLTLVITIIVLVIIIGITVSAVLGDNGLIAEIKSSKAFYEDLEKKENKRLYRMNLQKSLGVISKGQTAKDDRVYVDSNDDYAIIPKGFAVSKIKTVDSNGNVIEDETTIENGLVIYQTNGETIKDWTTAKNLYNQYVWIPVELEELELMFSESDSYWNLLYETEVKTKYMSKDLTGDLKLGNREMRRTNPGNTNTSICREPGLLSIDTEENAVSAGFSAIYDNNNNVVKSALRVMAESLVDDYKNMVESIKLYGGFYIGRYELGKIDGNVNKPMVRKGTVMNWRTWYFNYNSCKKLNLDEENNILNDTSEIRMMWSCLWDQMCRFISTRGQKVNLDDSRSYGNYGDSTVSTDISGFGKFNSTTGRSEEWKVNNIYDLAGNCWEETQEVYNNENRATRGGQSYNNGISGSVNARADRNPTSNQVYTVVTRPVIYIKAKDLNLVHNREDINSEFNTNIIVNEEVNNN